MKRITNTVWFQRPVVSKVSQVTSKKCNEARSDELCMWLGEKIPAQYKLERKVQLHQIHYITREIYRLRI